ncbi:MAG: RuvB-like domain-containing protein, partial [Acidobacteriota bacterium]
MRLTIKYRPKRLGQVIGQDKAVRLIQSVANRGQLGGRAFALTGPSGSGKTSLAYIIARMVADDLFITELDAANLTPAAIAKI